MRRNRVILFDSKTNYSMIQWFNDSMIQIIIVQSWIEYMVFWSFSREKRSSLFATIIFTNSIIYIFFEFITITHSSVYYSITYVFLLHHNLSYNRILYIVKVDQILWKGECDFLDITGFVNVLDLILSSSPSTTEVAEQSGNVVQSIIENADKWSIKTLLVCSQKAFPTMIRVSQRNPIQSNPIQSNPISIQSFV